MNNLVIPPSPNWYESKILTCTVDNTVIYGSRNEIVVIKSRPLDEPADIRIISQAHYERIVSVDAISNWESSKLVVSAADDKIVKLWDLETYECQGSNNTHTAITGKLIGSCFAGNDRVISISEYGFVSIWRIGNNEVSSLKNLFNFKVHVTCISSCPHASWLTAFGLKCGLVILADLRKSGKIVYKLRGHDKSVVSLTWCPTPFNIFPKNFPSKSRKIFNAADAGSADSAKEVNVSLQIDSDSADKANKKSKKTKTDLVATEQVAGKKTNPWINLKHVDDDEIEPDPPQEDTSENTTLPDSDFLKECEVLRQKILGSNVPSTDKDLNVVDPNENENKDKDNEKVHCNLYELQTVSDQNLCTSENIVDLMSDSELDNEIQEIFQPTKEYLLASSARGGSIYIWRAGTDGRIQRELPLSGKTGRKNNRTSDKAWITICWITPEILLSSSSTGELLQWDLLKSSEKSNIPQKKLVHHDHGTNLFSIAAPIRTFQVWEEENWRDRKDLHAWTIGQDRFLLNTSLLADRNTQAAYPTIGGHIYCLTSSPVDPCRIAVGIGDNTAKIWDLSRPHLQCIIMSNLWQKIHGKVLTLAWHPTKEMLLAYGTCEGRVGVVNTNNTSKQPTLLCQYFRSSIYNVEWGPINGNIEEIGLYVCGEGKLVLYNTDKPLEDPILITTPSKEYIAHMSWKPNYSMLAVGSKSGAIVLYDIHLKQLMTVYGEHKGIQTLLWHPEATAEDNQTSPYASWLAAGTNNATIPIYDLSELLVKDGSSNYNVVAVLSSHTKPVKNMAWSSYEGGKLVSCGEDGIAYVWNVKTNAVISMYIGHNFEPILSVLWSPLDKDYIITGAKDSTVRIWNILEHPPILEADVKQLLKTRLKLKLELRKNTKKDKDSDDEEPQKIKRDLMLHCTAKLQNADAAALIEDCTRLLSVNSSKNCDGESKSNESSSVETNNIDILKLFGDRSSMISLLEAEQEKHVASGKHFCSQHLSLWKGDISETIKDAIKCGRVTPWLISMAPMVSSKLWQEACEAYAKKLMEDAKSDPIETSSYLLACHKVEDAVQVLCEATLFREALMIAKCRLASSDPVINDIIQKWATFSIIWGSYEVAAQCFIYLEQYEEAAKALFKRSDPKVLEFAIELAKKSENKDLLDAVVARYNCFKTDKAVEGKEHEEPTKMDVVVPISENQLTNEVFHMNDRVDGDSITSSSSEQLSTEDGAGGDSNSEKLGELSEKLENTESKDEELLLKYDPKPMIRNGCGFAAIIQTVTTSDSDVVETTSSKLVTTDSNSKTDALEPQNEHTD